MVSASAVQDMISIANAICGSRGGVQLSLLVAVFAALGTLGCSAERPETAAPPAAGVETVSLYVLAANMGRYKGQTVRVCGRWRDPPPRRARAVAQSSWSLTAPNPPGTVRPHVYVVGVTPCRGKRPRLTNGCLTGRIARENGSLDLPEDILIASHVTGSYEWFLHPQCAAR